MWCTYCRCDIIIFGMLLSLKGVMELAPSEDRGWRDTRKDGLFENTMARLIDWNRGNDRIITEYLLRIKRKQKKYDMQVSQQPCLSSPQSLSSSQKSYPSTYESQNSLNATFQVTPTHPIRTPNGCPAFRLSSKKALGSIQGIGSSHMNCTFAQQKTESHDSSSITRVYEWKNSLLQKVRPAKSNLKEELHLSTIDALNSLRKEQFKRLEQISRDRSSQCQKSKKTKTEAREEEKVVAKLKSIDFGDLENKKGRQALPYIRQSAVEKNKKCLQAYVKMTKDRHFKRLQSLKKLSGIEEIIPEEKALCFLKVGIALPIKSKN